MRVKLRLRYADGTVQHNDTCSTLNELVQRVKRRFTQNHKCDVAFSWVMEGSSGTLNTEEDWEMMASLYDVRIQEQMSSGSASTYRVRVSISFPTLQASAQQPAAVALPKEMSEVTNTTLKPPSSWPTLLQQEPFCVRHFKPEPAHNASSCFLASPPPKSRSALKKSRKTDGISLSSSKALRPEQLALPPHSLNSQEDLAPSAAVSAQLLLPSGPGRSEGGGEGLNVLTISLEEEEDENGHALDGNSRGGGVRGHAQEGNRLGGRGRGVMPAHRHTEPSFSACERQAQLSGTGADRGSTFSQSMSTKGTSAMGSHPAGVMPDCGTAGSAPPVSCKASSFSHVLSLGETRLPSPSASSTLPMSSKGSTQGTHSSPGFSRVRAEENSCVVTGGGEGGQQRFGAGTGHMSLFLERGAMVARRAGEEGEGKGEGALPASLAAVSAVPVSKGMALAWDQQVLSSIKRTVTKHHFGSRLLH